WRPCDERARAGAHRPGRDPSPRVPKGTPMRTAALLTRDAKLAERFRRLLDRALHLVQGASLPVAQDQGPALPIDLVLVDLASAPLAGPGRPATRPRHADSMIVAVLPSAESAEPSALDVEPYELVLAADLPDAVLRAGVEQALRFQRLGQEAATLRRERQRAAAPPGPAPEREGAAAANSPGAGLKELGRVLAARLALHRL